MRVGYLAGSSLGVGGLELHTALGRTPQGLVAHPELFSGVVGRPDVTAAGLLAVADVAATRYADLGLAARLASLDPVVTVSGDRVRFESFSVCNGVHVRFDLLPDGIDSGWGGFGTTNVDVSPALRTALSTVGPGGLMHLAVGREELRVSTPEATWSQEKVPLPDRWVRGFAEVPGLSAAMEPRFTLTGPAAARLLGSLPRRRLPGPDVHLLPHRGGVRQTLGDVRGALRLPGAGRLAPLARVVRFARGLGVHQEPHGATGWVVELPGARLTLLLTAGAYRGFSGEGGLLTRLADPSAAQAGAALGRALGWEPVIDPAALAHRHRWEPRQVQAGLAWLAASGRVGHDLAQAGFFHRELPVDATQVLERHPRLVGGRRLAASGAVQAAGDGTWRVTGDRGQAYLVTRGPEGADGSGPPGCPDGPLRCDCPWEVDHRAGRGPCKHVLAVLVERASGPATPP